MNDINGKQLGNPDKVAEIFIKLVNNPDPPAILFLGSDAYKRATAKIVELSQQIEQWKDVSFSTDFEE